MLAHARSHKRSLLQPQRTGQEQSLQTVGSVSIL